MKPHPSCIDEYLQRYPRVCALVIAYSLGYATPGCAANILQDAHLRRQNWCEWIASAYGCDPRPAVAGAIRSRHHLRGYMADYQSALAIVRRANERGDHPLFASWF